MVKDLLLLLFYSRRRLDVGSSRRSVMTTLRPDMGKEITGAGAPVLFVISCRRRSSLLNCCVGIEMRALRDFRSFGGCSIVGSATIQIQTLEFTRFRARSRERSKTAQQMQQFKFRPQESVFGWFDSRIVGARRARPANVNSCRRNELVKKFAVAEQALEFCRNSPSARPFGQKQDERATIIVELELACGNTSFTRRRGDCRGKEF